MVGLGWKFVDGGRYKVRFPRLSAGEERLACWLLERLVDEPVAEERLLALLKKVCVEKGLIVEKASGFRVLEVVKSAAFGFGVFDALLADDGLEEVSVVSVNSPIRVYVRKQGWRECDCVISSEDFLLSTINKMARPLGRRITSQHPRLNAVLPDGSRLHALVSPVALNGVELTLRKFKRDPLSVADFISSGTVSARAAAFLWLVMESDVSVMIAGNTGSGKTSFLNALFSFVPLGERVILVEESPELNIPHEHKVRLVASRESGVGLGDLVVDTLRMRPDRVVVGEVRSREEVAALFDSLLAGQAKGCYSTFHADSAGEALSRLKWLGVPEENLSALDLVVVLKRLSAPGREERRVLELCEVSGASAVPLFSVGRDLVLRERQALSSSAVASRLCLSRSCSQKELFSLLSSREKELALLVGKGVSGMSAFGGMVRGVA